MFILDKLDSVSNQPQDDNGGKKGWNLGQELIQTQSFKPTATAADSAAAGVPYTISQKKYLIEATFLNGANDALQSIPTFS